MASVFATVATHWGEVDLTGFVGPATLGAAGKARACVQIGDDVRLSYANVGWLIDRLETWRAGVDQAHRHEASEAEAPRCDLKAALRERVAERLRRAKQQQDLRAMLMERGAERLLRAMQKLDEGNLVDATSEASAGAQMFETAWHMRQDGAEGDEGSEL